MNLTFKKYRAIDLTIFSVLSVVLEALIVLASNEWFPGVIYTLSLSVTVTSIVMVRWGLWAAIPALLSGVTVVGVYYLGGVAVGLDTVLIYLVGNLFMLFGYGFIRLVGRARIEDKKGFTSYLYVLIVYLLLLIGKTVVAVCMGKGFMIIANFNFAECTSLIIALLAVFVAKRQEGLFVDQKTYLLELEKKRLEEEKNAQDLL